MRAFLSMMAPSMTALRPMPSGGLPGAGGGPSPRKNLPHQDELRIVAPLSMTLRSR